MLTVIIVSYNTREITLNCLSRLYESEAPGFETILVDNASTDGIIEKVTKQFPQVKIIKNPKNLGFAKANNQAMKIASGDIFLLLNSDCFVELNTIGTILNKMKEPGFDVIGCKLLNQDETVQPSWGYFPNLRRITQMMFFIDSLPFVKNKIDSLHIRSEERYSDLTEVDWVTGAFMMLKKRVFEKTGGLDEEFFMYGEEIEWQYRIKNLNFKIWFDPEVYATHLMGASSPTRAPAVIGEIKGWKYWFSKYHRGWQEKALKLVVFAGCLLRLVFKPKWRTFYREALVKIWT
jgi:GT2 family glycosyltransferase